MTCNGCGLNFLAGALLGMGWMLLPISVQADALGHADQAGLLIVLALLCMLGAVAALAFAARTAPKGGGR